MSEPIFTAERLREHAAYQRQNAEHYVADMLEFAADLVERTASCRYCTHTREQHVDNCECRLCECQQFSEEPIE